MPVFHTKTIETILEPVAQQVSKLVILHEEAEDGNAMPDLARPVQVVKMAVDNLVKVGFDTINSSDDQILRQDMPPALQRVEESSLFLVQASQMLHTDPYSAPARKKQPPDEPNLTDLYTAAPYLSLFPMLGADDIDENFFRILQGTSALLLAFDESEVRKIIRVCKSVLEYLAITEVVESMEDLVTYVKNLSPVLTKMTKAVDAREKELTHHFHRDLLIRSLEQIKNLTPILISGIKIYITAKQGGSGVHESQTNRDFVVRKVSDEIHEIIRVLQLTTYDEEEWDADDLTVMKKAQSAIEGRTKQANDWLQDPAALVGSGGEKALRQILEDCRKIAERCSHPSDREGILKTASDVESMLDALTELRSQGKGSSPQAMSLAREIQNKVRDLQQKTLNGIQNTERSGMRKPAPTVQGKVEQAQRWLTNPAIDDKGLGEMAARQVVSEGRKVANLCTGQQRADLQRLCDEVEILTNQLSDMVKKGQGNSPQAKACARHLSEKLHMLQDKIQDALVSQIADNFNDITSPLKHLSDAAMTPLGTPGRENNFDDKARKFQAHSASLANTANMVATAGGCRNKKTVEGIFQASSQIDDLNPQLLNAAKLVLMNPNNQAAVEHFDLLKKQWSDNMERLRSLVDDAADSAALIKAEEEGILRDTQQVEDGIRLSDSPKIVSNASNIARRANRVLQVAQNEAENSEDPGFVGKVNNASENLKRTITPMVQNAKTMSMNPRDQNAAGGWRKSNQQLIDSVGQVRQAVTVPGKTERYPYGSNYPPPPDMSQLHIAGVSSAPLSQQAPKRPPPPPSSDAGSDDFNDLINALNAGQLAHTPRMHISPSPVVGSSRSVSVRVPDQYAMDGHMPGHEEATLKPDQAFRQEYGAPPPVPPPPIPPPPQETYGYYPRAEGIPTRPPPPHQTQPPRPPPPDTDDEDEMSFPIPQPNQPIMQAAHDLHMEAKQWSSKDNDIIAAAKKMALLMAKLSQLVRGEGGTKKDLIATAKKIAEASEEVTRLAKKLATDCTDKKMRLSLLQVCERIPTIGTQLKILSTVKATMLGAQGSEEDQEATEMLVGNAQNLMQAVKETVRAAEAASIKIRVDSGYTICWIRKRPWYT